MGLLREYLERKHQDKQQSELRDLDLWKSVIGMDASKMKPGFEQIQNDAFFKMYKKAPPELKGQLEKVYPIMVGRNQMASRLGSLDKSVSTQDEKSDKQGKQPQYAKGAASREPGIPTALDASEGGDPKALSQPSQTATKPQAGGLFKSAQELQEDKRQENALAIEKATKEYQAKKMVDIQTGSLQRIQDAKDLKELDARADLSEDEKQRLATNIATRGTEGGWASSRAIFPNGQVMYGSISKSNPFVMRVPNGTPQGQEIVLPSMARIVKADEPEAQQKDEEIFGAYAEKHGLDPSKLTSSQKLDARAEAKAKEPGEKGAEILQNETALRNLHRDWSEDQIKAAASQMYLDDMKQKSRQREVQISVNSTGGQVADDDLRELAGYAIRTGQDPKLAYRDPSSFARYNRIKAELIKSMGGAGEAAATTAGYKADVASLRKLQSFADFTNAFAGFTEGQMERLDQQAKQSGLTKTRFWNKPIAAWKTQVTGDPQFAQYLFQLETTKAEVNRILTAPGSQGQVPEGMRKDLEKFLNDELSPEAIVGVTKQAKLDIEGRRKSYEDQLKGISGRISGATPAPADRPGSDVNTPKTIRARDPKGKLHEAPAGTALPAGWKLEK